MSSWYSSCDDSEPFDIALQGGSPALPCPYAPATSTRPSDITFDITLDVFPDNGSVEYVAASPPDHRSSFGGSALPFASAKQAFEGTPNRGTITVTADRKVSVNLQYPNAYYAGLGSDYIPPTVYIRYMVNGKPIHVKVKVSHGIPYRSLAHPVSRSGAEFYDNLTQLPVRSQEQILLDSAYPNVNAQASNFWGLKPAV